MLFAHGVALGLQRGVLGHERLMLLADGAVLAVEVAVAAAKRAMLGVKPGTRGRGQQQGEDEADDGGDDGDEPEVGGESAAEEGELLGAGVLDGKDHQDDGGDGDENAQDEGAIGAHDTHLPWGVKGRTAATGPRVPCARPRTWARRCCSVKRRMCAATQQRWENGFQPRASGEVRRVAQVAWATA